MMQRLQKAIIFLHLVGFPFKFAKTKRGIDAVCDQSIDRVHETVMTEWGNEDGRRIAKRFLSSSSAEA